jgi:hypothetical protein
MINNGDGQHPALDTITRITPTLCGDAGINVRLTGVDMCGRPAERRGFTG